MSCLASCCASLTCGLCSSVASGISKKSARLAYCGLFGLSLIVSWILREVGTPLLEKFPWINTSDGDTHTKEWYQIQAVLRTSNSKLTILAETISKFGAGLFLLVQVIILLDGVHTWNDAWVAKDEQKWYVALLAISVGCYLAAFTFSGILFIWFNPSGHDCGLNVFFIVMTMILAFVFAVIALNPSVNGSLLPASVISVYCAYVCYTALSSEPHDYVCNGLHNKSKAVTISTLVLGMLTTVLSVLYSALRAGSSTTFLSPPSSPNFTSLFVGRVELVQLAHSKPFQMFAKSCVAAGKKLLLEGEDVEEGTENKKDIEGRPVSYSYSFFHLIFALASMYSAMLLSGWTSSSESSDLIDVGWTSVWVRICSQWVTAGLYIWTLVAPLLFPDREFF
ncbi:tms1 isoform f [Citrus sinensis]|uniref:Tms1 isoform f n=1 Tax=Citrus sinensis TaxID=2711 RepID=A0ACB8I7J0_CITSI|nr:tms1 isoform f [Citrus sinensis]